MDLFDTIESMRTWSRATKRRGETIAFVPTMGGLHGGHLSLMRAGRERADRLVVSIYVNPTQFGPHEDLETYPRTPEEDLAACRDACADAIFTPTDAAMYPDGFRTAVRVAGLTETLCGQSRPGHFDGVTTVVAKLFHIVQPNIALFGEKDFQQLQVIRRMTVDLDLPVDIVGCPIVREPDGLAMSSRNRRLSADERPAAISLSRALARARTLVAEGGADRERILADVRAIVEGSGARLDYADIVDAETLRATSLEGGSIRLCIAAFVGGTRLIDNGPF